MYLFELISLFQSKAIFLLKFLSLVSESNPVEESSNSSPYHRATRETNSLIARLLIQRHPSTTDRSRMKRARARISLFPSTFPSAACKIESIPRSNLRHLLFLPIVLTKENQPSPLELIQPTSEGNAAVLGRRDAIPGMWESRSGGLVINASFSLLFFLREGDRRGRGRERIEGK